MRIIQTLDDTDLVVSFKPLLLCQVDFKKHHYFISDRSSVPVFIKFSLVDLRCTYPPKGAFKRAFFTAISQRQLLAP